MSRTPAASTGFLVEYVGPGADYPNASEFTAEPVTPHSITVVAGTVAALVRGLGLS